jgi:hypothetical protein
MVLLVELGKRLAGNRLRLERKLVLRARKRKTFTIPLPTTGLNSKNWPKLAWIPDCTQPYSSAADNLGVRWMVRMTVA